MILVINIDKTFDKVIVPETPIIIYIISSFSFISKQHIMHIPKLINEIINKTIYLDKCFPHCSVNLYVP